MSKLAVLLFKTNPLYGNHKLKPRQKYLNKTLSQKQLYFELM